MRVHRVLLGFAGVVTVAALAWAAGPTTLLVKFGLPPKVNTVKPTAIVDGDGNILFNAATPGQVSVTNQPAIPARPLSPTLPSDLVTLTAGPGSCENGGTPMTVQVQSNGVGIPFVNDPMAHKTLILDGIAVSTGVPAAGQLGTIVLYLGGVGATMWIYQFTQAPVGAVSGSYQTSQALPQIPIAGGTTLCAQMTFGSPSIVPTARSMFLTGRSIAIAESRASPGLRSCSWIGSSA